MSQQKLFNNYKNQLICGDNLEVLSTIDDESIDLIYIDPPFFSNRHYEIVWGDEAEIRSFEDRWEGGINVYVDWMKQRIMELHRILKPTGSFYLHCDWHACHYLKVMCDEIFGYNNLRNEIIWYYRRWSAASNKFQRMHDNILFYTKTSDYTFNKIFIEPTNGQKIKHDKGWDRNSVMINSKRQPQLIIYDQKKVDEAVKRGKINLKEFARVVNVKNTDTVAPDVWEINFLNSQAKERMGYPTQKPEELLERIIKASSKPGDIILDAFCGCGTAMAVAEKLNRNWIGIDISPSAISLIKEKRFRQMNVSEKDIDIIGMPETPEHVKKFKPYEFQYWVINEMHGTGSPKKSGDMGIDGFSFFEHCPIQVKQSEHVGRNVVDNFETALKRYYTVKKDKMKGYIVAFSFTKGAREEVTRAKKDNFDIKLVTIQDILDKKLKIGYKEEI